MASDAGHHAPTRAGAPAQPAAAASPAAAAAAAAAAPRDKDYKSQREQARAVHLAAAQRQVARAEACLGAPGKDMLPSVRFATASSLLLRAAETFRMYQQWRRAAQALERASEAEKLRAATLPCAVLAADSAELYARVDANEAARLYRAASGLFAALGRFTTAGNVLVRAGELEESDGARTAAADAFAAAAQFYLAEDAYALCVGALARAAALLALEDAFAEAHALFERAARVALDDNLTRWHASRLVLSAGLCLLAAARACAAEEGSDGRSGEPAEVVARLEAYQAAAAKRDSGFGAGRERRFLLDCLDTSALWAVDDFMDHVWNYDYVARLEEHDLALCEVVYRSIKEGPPSALAKAPMAASDMNAVRSKQETVQVEVEELVPMTAKDLRETGLQRVLDAEVAKEREEAAADAAAEFLLLHGITKEEQEKRDRDAANRF